MMSKEPTSPQVIVDPSWQVSGPSTGLLITGILGVVFDFTLLIAEIIGTSLSTFWEEEIPDRYEQFAEGVFGMGMAIVGLVLSAFVIYAALKMKELNQWSICVAASIIAIIPCLSPCCLVGLPIGIWCLVVLMRPEVRSAFK